jgi:hypothetical protein
MISWALLVGMLPGGVRGSVVGPLRALLMLALKQLLVQVHLGVARPISVLLLVPRCIA